MSLAAPISIGATPPPVVATGSPHVVILGASTAAGTGATSGNSWAALTTTFLQGIDAGAVVTNLAVPGSYTSNLCPTGSTPANGQPDVSHNVTAALAALASSSGPKLIILAGGSNDIAAGYSLADIEANIQAVVAAATAARIPIWITTTQPRTLGLTGDTLDATALSHLSTLASWITSTFPTRAIDFWSFISNTDGTIRSQYGYGDGIHLNDSGHRRLYQKILTCGALQSILPAHSIRIAFHTSGATFAPQVGVANSGSVVWTTDTGAVSTSATPSFSFGAAGAHVTYLEVTSKWADLTYINCGYDAGDLGEAMPPVNQIPQQNVTQIVNLDLAGPSLQSLVLSRNRQITSISVVSFAALQFVEAFFLYPDDTSASGGVALTSLNVSGSRNIRRICLERAPLESCIGLQDCTLLEDFRNRGGHVSTYNFGTAQQNPLQYLWHFCVGDSTQLTTLGIEGRTMPGLRQLWPFFSPNLSGTFALNAPSLQDFDGRGTGWTRLTVTLAHCFLCDFTQSSLTQAGVDDILAALAANTMTGGSANLAGLPAPSAAGLASITTLQGRGWTVAHT